MMGTEFNNNDNSIFTKMGWPICEYRHPYGLGIDLWAAIISLGLWPRTIMAALGPIPRPYHYKQSLTYKYLVNILVTRKRFSEKNQ